MCSSICITRLSSCLSIYLHMLRTISHQHTTNTSEPQPEIYRVTNAQEPPAPLQRQPLSYILCPSFVCFYKNIDYPYDVGRKGSIYQKVKSANTEEMTDTFDSVFRGSFCSSDVAVNNELESKPPVGPDTATHDSILNIQRLPEETAMPVKNAIEN